MKRVIGILIAMVLAAGFVSWANAAPTGLANFTSSAYSTATLTYTWTAASTTGTFDHYELWIGTSQSDVESRVAGAGATEWDNADDGALAVITTATTTVTGLTSGTLYYAKIWAVDGTGEISNPASAIAFVTAPNSYNLTLNAGYSQGLSAAFSLAGDSSYNLTLNAGYSQASSTAFSFDSSWGEEGAWMTGYLNSGQDYLYSFYVNLNILNAGDNLYFDITGAGNILSRRLDTGMDDHGLTYAKNNWLYYTGVFKADQDGVHTFKFRKHNNNGPAEIYVDQIRLSRNLVSNGGMEGTYVSGVAPGWLETDATGIGTPSEETTIVHSGSKAQKYVSTGVGGNWALLSQVITVTPGKYYTVNFWAYVLSGTPQLTINPGSWGVNSTILGLVNMSGASWKKYSITVKPLTSTFVIWAKSIPAYSFYIDDVSVVALDSAPATTATPSATADSFATGKWGDAEGAFTVDGWDTLSYPATGNLAASAGTVAMWVAPQGWSGSDTKAHNFASVEPGMESGLVGYWKFNEGTGSTTADSAGSNTGTLGTTTVGDTAEPTWVAGKFGQALKFDGVNDYVNIGNSVTLAPASEITISAWVNNYQTKVFSILNRWGVNASYNFYISLVGNIVCNIQDSAGNGSDVTATAGIIPARKWTFVTYTFSSLYERLYVNSILVKEETPTISSLRSVVKDTYIGYDYYGTDQYGAGLIDDVRIYNRALTAAEIASQYAAGTMLYTDSVDKKVKFNIGNVSLSKDISATGLNWQANVWHHLVGTWNSAGANLYVDGAVQATNATITLPTAFGSNLYVGSDSSDASFDDARVYDRALSATEITALYTAASGTAQADIYVDQARLNKNLVNNGGMEGTYTDGVAPNWTYASTDDTRLEETVIVHSGSKAQKITWTVTGGYADIRRTGSMVAGKYYTVSAWVYKVTTGYVALCIGSPTNNVDQQLAKVATSTLNQWKKISITFRYAGVCSNIVGIAVGCTAIVDDVSLIPLDSAPASTATPSATADSYATGKWGDTEGAFTVDGRDTLSYPATGNLAASAGTVAMWVAPQGWSGSDTKSHSLMSVAPSGLVGWWKFDEGSGTTAIDSSGNDNTGTLINGPVWASGKLARALSFDGSNDYVSVGNGASLDITGTITVSAWIKFIATSDSINKGIIVKSGATYPDTVGYALRTGFAQWLNFSARINGTLQSTPGTYNPSSLNWLYVVGTYDGSNLRLWVDGVMRTEVTGLSGNITSNTGNLNIGYYSSLGIYFPGLIDDVRIYNRALTAVEIATQYAARTMLYTDSTDKKVKFNIGDVSLSTDISAWAANSWHHLAGNWNSAGATLYVDGTQAATTSSITLPFGFASKLYLGSDSSDSSFDDARVYDRALSASEITSLYTASSGTAQADIYVDQVRLNKNLVVNGGMEGTYTAGVAANWTTYGNASGTWTEETNIVHSGSKSQKVIIAGPNNDQGVKQTINSLTTGKWYTVSGWVRTTTGTGNVILELGTSGTSYQTVFNIGTSWRKIGGTFKKISGTNILYFISASSSNPPLGFYVDDVSVVPLDSAPASTATPSATADSFATGKWSDTEGAFTVDGRDTLSYPATGNLAASAGTVAMWVAPQGWSGSDTKTHSLAAVEPGMESGLVGYWKFNEGSGSTTTDSSGNSNTGTLGTATVGDAAEPIWVDGKFGQALKFDGVDDIIQVPYSGTIDPGVGDFTWSAWINLGAINRTPTIFSTYRSASKFIQLNVRATNVLDFRERDDVSGIPTLVGYKVFVPNTWYHVVAIRTGATMKLYVNGLFDNSRADGPTGDIFDDSSKLIIGADSTNAAQTLFGSYFNGRIDDVRIYNRALTAAEIAAQYAAMLYTDSADKKVKFNIGNVSLSKDISATGLNWQANAWHHLVGTWNSAGANLYVDGAVQATNATITLPASFGSTLNIGSDNSDASFDEARVFSKALSAAEISDIYNAEKLGKSSSEFYIDDARLVKNLIKDGGMEGSSGITNGLVGRWKMDEGSGTTAADSSGNGNNGTLTNGPTWVDGKYNKALSFDGVDDYVNAGNGSSLNLADNITISLWINPSSITSSFVVLGKWYTQYEVQQVNNTISLYKYKDTSPFYESGLAVTGITLNEWQHIVIILSGNSIKGYRNGILSNSPTASFSGTQQGSYPLTIGARSNLQFPYRGLIDDVRIYNRALTANEVMANYLGSSFDILGTATLTLDLAAHSGAYAFKCVAGANNSGIYQELSLTANSFYTLSAWVKGGAATDDIILDVSDFSDAQGITTQTFSDIGTTYVRKSITFKTGTDITGRARIYTPTSGQTFYVDDVSLVGTTSATAPAGAMSSAAMTDASAVNAGLNVAGGNQQSVSGVRGKAVQFNGAGDYLEQAAYQAGSVAVVTATGCTIPGDLSAYGSASGERKYLLIVNGQTTNGWGYIGAAVYDSGTANTAITIYDAKTSGVNRWKNGATPAGSSFTYIVRRSSYNVTANKFSAGAWIKTTTNGPVMAKENAYSLGVASTKISAKVSANGSTWTSVDASASAAVNDNSWHYLVMTADGTNLKAYLDGQLAGSAIAYAGIYDSSSSFRLGYDGITYFTGVIDEPFVTGSVLSAADVLRLYKHGRRAADNAGDNLEKLAGATNNNKAVVASTDSIFSGSSDGNVSEVSIDADTLIEQWPVTNEVNSLTVVDNGFFVVGTATSTGAAKGNLGYVAGADLTTPIATRKWLSLSALYDAAGLKIYQDGVLSASKALTGAIPTSTNDLGLGGRLAGSLAAYPYKGKFDEFEVYNAELSAGDIANMVNRIPWLIPNDPSDSVKVRITDTLRPGITDKSDANFMLINQPKVVLIHPAATDSWTIGEVKNIIWQTYGAAITGHTFKLEYSLNGGGAWTPLSSGQANDGQFEWSIPIVESTVENAKVRITDEATGYSSVSAVSENFKISLPSLSITYPNGGETIYATGTCNLTWSQVGSITDNVRVRYSTNYTANPATAVWTTVLPGPTPAHVAAKAYPWSVPDIVSDTVRLEITDMGRLTTTDISNADFRIVAPSLAITGPTAGQSVTLGNTYTLSWTALGEEVGAVSNALTIKYKDGSGIWQFAKDPAGISANANQSAEGSFSWKVPSDAVPTSSAQIKIYDSQRPATMVSVDLVIVAASVTVAAPNGGEMWVMGTAHDILWTAQGGVSKEIKLEYTSNGSTYTTIKAYTGADEDVPQTKVVNGITYYYYSWTVPDIGNSASSVCKVRITDTWSGWLVESERPKDVSDASFTISLPVIMVNQPLLGEILAIGDTKVITWETLGEIKGDVDGKIKIEYSTLGQFAQGDVFLISSQVDKAAVAYTWTDVGITDKGTGQEAQHLANSARVRITDLGRPAAKGESNAFFIKPAPVITVSQPPADTVASWLMGTQHYIAWSCNEGPVSGQLKLSYLKKDGNTEVEDDWILIAEGKKNDGTYPWTVPSSLDLQSAFNSKIRILDPLRTPNTKAISSVFTIAMPEITVTQPGSSTAWAIGDTVPITFTTTGAVGLNNLLFSYKRDSSVPDWTLFAAAPVKGGDNYTYSWVVEGGIFGGTTPLIKIIDGDRPGAYGISNSFEVGLQPSITTVTLSGGAGSLYPDCVLGEVLTINWVCKGYNLQGFTVDYSNDNFETVGHTRDITTITLPASARSLSWTIPEDALSGRDAIKVRVKSTRTDVTAKASGAFSIRGGFSVVTPEANVKWASNEAKTVSWISRGTINNVKVFYKYSTTYSAGAWTSWSSWASIYEGANSNSCSWTVSDLWKTQTERQARAKIRIEDATDPTVYIESNEFDISYYLITWKVLDYDNFASLTDLTVSCRGTNNWTWAAAPISSPVAHYYPYGTYTTTWSKETYLNAGLNDWVANNSKALTIYLESSISAQIEWHVITSFVYRANNTTTGKDELQASFWLERRGILKGLVTDDNGVTMLDPRLRNAVLEVFDGNTLVKTFTIDTPNDRGIYDFLWSGTTLESGKTYFVKATIYYHDANASADQQTFYTSGAGLNITEEKERLSMELALKNTITTGLGVNTAAGETVATKIAAERALTSTEIVAVKGDTAAVRLATETTIPSQIVVVKGETAKILTAAESTIPEKITTMREEVTTSIKTEIKPHVQSGILTRDTTVKQGDTLDISYRTTTGLSPTITVYDSKDRVRLNALAMKEIGVTGVYVYKVKFLGSWGTGDFTVVCTEPANGTVDALVMTVTQSNLEDVAGQVSAVVGSTSGLSGLKNVAETLNSQFNVIDSTLAKLSANIVGKVTETKDALTSLQTVFAQLEAISKQIQGIGGTAEGINLEKLYNVSKDKQNDVTYIKNKTQELKAAMEINQKLMQNVANKPIVQSWFEFK